ncbi:hypothetical protein D3C76_1527710 [compost metagenome]
MQLGQSNLGNDHNDQPGECEQFRPDFIGKRTAEWGHNNHRDGEQHQQEPGMKRRQVQHILRIKR